MLKLAYRSQVTPQRHSNSLRLLIFVAIPIQIDLSHPLHVHLSFQHSKIPRLDLQPVFYLFWPYHFPYLDPPTFLHHIAFQVDTSVILIVFSTSRNCSALTSSRSFIACKTLLFRAAYSNFIVVCLFDICMWSMKLSLNVVVVIFNANNEGVYRGVWISIYHHYPLRWTLLCLDMNQIAFLSSEKRLGRNANKVDKSKSFCKRFVHSSGLV